MKLGSQTNYNYNDPDIKTLENVDTTFNIALFNNANFDITQHPKIRSLEFKIKSLNIDRKLILE